jgi:hypothetical protein
MECPSPIRQLADVQFIRKPMSADLAFAVPQRSVTVSANCSLPYPACIAAFARFYIGPEPRNGRSVLVVFRTSVRLPAFSGATNSVMIPASKPITAGQTHTGGPRLHLLAPTFTRAKEGSLCSGWRHEWPLALAADELRGHI